MSADADAKVTDDDGSDLLDEAASTAVKALNTAGATAASGIAVTGNSAGFSGASGTGEDAFGITAGENAVVTVTLTAAEDKIAVLSETAASQVVIEGTLGEDDAVSGTFTYGTAKVTKGTLSSDGTDVTFTGGAGAALSGELDAFKLSGEASLADLDSGATVTAADAGMTVSAGAKAGATYVLGVGADSVKLENEDTHAADVITFAALNTSGSDSITQFESTNDSVTFKSSLGYTIDNDAPAAGKITVKQSNGTVLDVDGVVTALNDVTMTSGQSLLYVSIAQDSKAANVFQVTENGTDASSLEAGEVKLVATIAGEGIAVGDFTVA